jgi:hypothetical protein
MTIKGAATMIDKASDDIADIVRNLADEIGVAPTGISLTWSDCEQSMSKSGFVIMYVDIEGMEIPGGDDDH